MKRQLLIALILMLCAFRSFSGMQHSRVIFLPGTSSDLLQSPLSACRYKKPSPFQCVQVMKKRLSKPPDSGGISIFNGNIQQSTSSNDALPAINNRLLPAASRARKAASTLFFAAFWHSCGIERNVFHPPPSIA